MPGIDFQAVRDQVPISRVLELIDYQPLRQLGPELAKLSPAANCGLKTVANGMSRVLRKYPMPPK